MVNKTIRRLIFVLTLALIGVGCNDSSTGVGNEDQEPATVEGQVDDTGSDSNKAAKMKSVEGAVVTAARVTSEGELQSIGGAEAQTNAQGEFSLDIAAEALANNSDRIVVVAENSGQSAKTFVTSEVRSGSTVEVQPISFESSAETEVYQEVIANGDADVVAKADIEVAVQADAAADIESNTSYAAEVASAIAAKARAKADLYAEQGVEFTDDRKEQVLQAKADAQVKLESQLNAAANSEEEQAAFDTFLKTVAEADIEAGIDATAAAKASESSARVLVSHSADLSTEAQAEMRKRTAYMLTFALDQAVQAQLQAAGASEATVTAAADAAADLRAEVKAMTEATESNVSSAFASFNSEIETLVSGDANLSGDAFVSTNTEINSNNGSKATLESTLSGSIGLNLLLDAYTQFYSSVQSTVEATFTGASQSETEAYTQLLVLINVAS